MTTFVKIFKGSIDTIERYINIWVELHHAELIGTSLCFDHSAGGGMVVALVVYRREAPIDDEGDGVLMGNVSQGPFS